MGTLFYPRRVKRPVAFAPAIDSELTEEYVRLGTSLPISQGRTSSNFDFHDDIGAHHRVLVVLPRIITSYRFQSAASRRVVGIGGYTRKRIRSGDLASWALQTITTDGPGLRRRNHARSLTLPETVSAARSCRSGFIGLLLHRLPSGSTLLSRRAINFQNQSTTFGLSQSIPGTSALETRQNRIANQRVQ